MAVTLTQPPASLGKTPEEIAWLEQLARLVNALVSSGGPTDPDDLFAPWRPTTLLYPGRFFYDRHPDVGTGNGTPIWVQYYDTATGDTTWGDANGNPI